MRSFRFERVVGFYHTIDGNFTAKNNFCALYNLVIHLEVFTHWKRKEIVMLLPLKLPIYKAVDSKVVHRQSKKHSMPLCLFPPQPLMPC